MVPRRATAGVAQRPVDGVGEHGQRVLGVSRPSSTLCARLGTSPARMAASMPGERSPRSAPARWARCAAATGGWLGLGPNRVGSTSVAVQGHEQQHDLAALVVGGDERAEDPQLCLLPVCRPLPPTGTGCGPRPARTGAGWPASDRPWTRSSTGPAARTLRLGRHLAERGGAQAAPQRHTRR